MGSDCACRLRLIRFALIAAGVCNTSLPSNKHNSGNERPVASNMKCNELKDKTGLIYVLILNKPHEKTETIQ